LQKAHFISFIIYITRFPNRNLYWSLSSCLEPE
jgi:hypothetical protein